VQEDWNWEIGAAGGGGSGSGCGPGVTSAFLNQSSTRKNVVFIKSEKAAKTQRAEVSISWQL